MKITAYECNKCKRLARHKDMRDDNICYNCWEEQEREIINTRKDKSEEKE